MTCKELWSVCTVLMDINAFSEEEAFIRNGYLRLMLWLFSHNAPLPQGYGGWCNCHPVTVRTCYLSCGSCHDESVISFSSCLYQNQCPLRLNKIARTLLMMKELEQLNYNVFLGQI